MKIKIFQTGQSLMELIVGIGLITVVAGALAIVTTNSLKNSQFSKNQVQATKLAQENIERVRAIKNFNYGICTQADGATCSTWEDIWATQFGTFSGNCSVGVNCFNLFTTAVSCPLKIGGTTPFCIKFNISRQNLGNGFTGQIIVEDEPNGQSQKRVTSRVYWTDSSGEHSSDLVTILSRI